VSDLLPVELPETPVVVGTPGRRGLWVEVALTLALITLTTILANAFLFWMLASEMELQRRTDLALSVGRTLRAQMEASPDTRRWKEVAKAFRTGGLEISDLWVVHSDLQPVLVLEGGPPHQPDPGLEAAMQRHEHVEVVGDAWRGRRSVVVTEPVVQGNTVAALRVGLVLEGDGPAAPGLGLVLGFTLLTSTIVALSGYALLRRRLLAPLQRIQETTRRIAGGEFGVVNRGASARELAELAADLNVLSVSLASYRQRTSEQLASLERANEDLRKAQEGLIRSERLASVGRLAAGLAHEVGNPLAAVLGYTELLASGLDDPEMERDLVRRTQKEIHRIHAILRDLLDYARPGTGERVEVWPGQALAEAVETVSPQPAFRDVELSTHCAEELPPLLLERDKLHQVLVNLALNAADAIDGPGAVRLSAELGDQELVFTCLDDGPGFDEALLPTVFEPFVTSKEAGRGTGLGLAICLSILEGEGGWIEASNASEGGARVRFGLPVPGAVGGAEDVQDADTQDTADEPEGSLA
jgi:signal transduction histidine kinase